MTRNDPISKFYKPLEVAEKISYFIFILSILFSIFVIFIDKFKYPYMYSWLQITLLIFVIANFISDIVIKLYFSARAASQRMLDFTSNAFDVPLADELSHGYYNTPQGDIFSKLSTSILENSLFTKEILRKMLFIERVWVSACSIFWMIAIFCRSTNLEILTAISQALLSQQILSHWITMEWLRARVEKIYDDIYTQIQTFSIEKEKEFHALAIKELIEYESSKALAGISLSTKIFKKINNELSKRWINIISQLNLR